MLSVNILYLRYLGFIIAKGYVLMAGENENTTLSADRVMTELIADVEQRWQQLDAYKRSVGTGIPFSQASAHWQNYIRNRISNEISRAKGIPFEEARSRFEDFIREAAVVDHITENPSEDSKRLFALKSQMRGEKDEIRQSELQQHYNDLSNEIFAKLPEVEKTRLTDRFIDNQIVPKHANLKAQAEINAPKEGYCLKGITESLYKINDKYGLDLLPENTPENERLDAFMQGLRDKDGNAGKHIFHTNKNQTFGQIAEREGIRPGAIVILDDSKGNPHHAMFWTGKRDENGEPQLIGFNGMGAEEESNVVLSYAKSGNARVGTIIDIGGMVAVSVQKREQSQKLTFEQIIETVSDAEMVQQYQPLSKSQLQEDNQKNISDDLQRSYLAYYAKAAFEHVGFDKFSPANQQSFKSEIEKLYAGINADCPQGEFLQEMSERTAAFIEDRHFEIGIGEKTIYGGEKAEKRSVGDNFFHNKNKPESYHSLGEGWGEESGGRFPMWQIGEMKNGDEDILIVSIPNLGGKNDYETWKGFIETFDRAYLENKEKWETGRIILDVRGNRGGEDKPIDHVAKRLYGNLVNTYKRCEIKDTALSNHFLHQHGAYKPQNYEKDGLTADNLVERSHFSGQTKTLFDETAVYYPFNEKDGFQGRTDILIDRDVGSSAESAYTSFYHHPNVRYVGENTAGKQQYTQGTFMTPWGGSMRVAVTKLTYWDREGENIEVKGHKADVDCRGQDAFAAVMAMDRDSGRVMGFREKNEQVAGKEVLAEYDPQAASDPRKAYYAKYLDPAIASIERSNISQENIASRLAEVRSKQAALRGNREEAENSVPENTVTAVERQGQDKFNARLLNRMRGQMMDGKP